MFTLDEVLAATGGRLVGPAPAAAFAAITTDSRHVTPDALFVCLRGEHHDGHAFAAAAIAAGAAGVVAETDSEVALPAGFPVIRVASGLQAYGHLARAWRRKLGPRVIAVTGSSGKTSTKELLAAYLGHFFKVYKSEANHNNEVGVPLTLLGLTAEHQVAVVELGMRAPGEIAYLTELAEPDVGVITNMGTAHIGRLGSREAIADAKAELWRHLPAGGTAIVPYDDPLASKAAGAWGGACVSWSLTEPAATVWAHDVHPVGEGQDFVVYWKAGHGNRHGRAEITLPQWGEHHRANALAAIAAGWALGVVPSPRMRLDPALLAGRSRRFEAGGIVIFDDAYNANPESMRAAAAAFASAPTPGRRFVVVGDMAELGESSDEAHTALGAYLGALDVAGVVAVGANAGLYARGHEAVVAHEEVEAACQALSAMLKPGDRVLVKASRAARFEVLVERLQALLGGA